MSIDEVRCTLPESVHSAAEAEAFVKRLKGTLHAHLGDTVTYSVGIGPNRFLAKLASDMGKPDGCFIIEKQDLPHCLHRLKLRDFCGIGRNMEQRLKDHGIATVAQLTSASRETLHAVWGGINGHYMWHWLRGEPAGQGETRRRSLGHSHVLPTALRNERGVHAVCHRLLQKAAMRLRKLDYYAGSLSMFVEFTDGHTWSREVRFTETQDTFVFLEAFEKLWRQPPRRAGIPPLKTGINFAPIIPAHRVTPDFLLHDARHDKLCRLMDGLNKQFGQNTVSFGGALGALDYTPMRIAFTRIPDQETEG
jgi:DNA polymerase-4